MTTIRHSLVVLALVGGLAACAGGPPPTTASTPADPATPTTAPVPRPARTFHVASDGVAAQLFLPPGTGRGRSRAILFVGGSGGGISASDAPAAIAAQGFVVMQLGYFSVPGEPLSPALTNIPIEYFVTAAQLLAEQPEVDPAHVAVWGTSRGSEPAALLAGDYPDLVHGAVLSSPSSVVNRALPDRHLFAWTLHGKPVPAVPLTDLGVADPTDAPDAYLPVEKVKGPIVTICGKLDPVWDSCAYSAVIAQRAGAARVAALTYPDVGHSPVEFGAALAAGRSGVTLPGGSPETDIAAERDALPRITALLNAS